MHDFNDHYRKFGIVGKIRQNFRLRVQKLENKKAIKLEKDVQKKT